MKLNYHKRIIWTNVITGLIASGMAIFLLINQLRVDFPVILAALLALFGWGTAIRCLRKGYLIIENGLIRDNWLRPTKLRLTDVLEVRLNHRQYYVISTRTDHLTINLSMMDTESRKKVIRVFHELGFEMYG